MDRTKRRKANRKRGGLDLGAGRTFLHDRGVESFFGHVAPDFDDPLPEDFLITPLPEDFDKPKTPR